LEATRASRSRLNRPQGFSQRGTDLAEENGAPSFEEIYEAYGEKVLNLAYRMTANEETARDLTQDIFLKVYESLTTFEQRSHIYTWIYRIAVNHIYNHLKRERRRQWFRLLDENVSDILREDELDPGFRERTQSQPPAADRMLESSERARVVWRTVQQLPVKYRVPLVLHHYEEMSYKEIAETMELSMSAVEARIHRAKKQLIRKLETLLKHL
jgi:RNA polymerase sigma-70 factor (ECF subfamily)